MRGFVVILVTIMIGFSLIFYTFNRDVSYSDHLYDTYKLLYGDIEDSNFSVSEKIMLSVIMVLLSVILLNLLISIMGDSFDKIQERRTMTDSQTRLDMIMEANILRRKLNRRKTSQIGYLIFCEPGRDEEEEDPQNSEWEGRINVMKRILRQNEQKTATKIQSEVSTVRKEMKQLKDRVNSIEQKLSNEISFMQKKVEQEVGAVRKNISNVEETIQRNQKEVLNTIKSLQQENLSKFVESISDIKNSSSKLFSEKRKKSV